MDLSIDISGTNIGYIYLFLGYFDVNAGSLNITDTDFLESPDTREVGGVYYPVWDENGFTLNYTWQPIVFGISDGTQNAVALFTPEQYGVDAASATYSVEGLYTFAQTGESLYAKLYFQDSKLVSVYGFTGDGSTGAPREITPAQGDTFTIYEKWMDVDSNGAVTGTVQERHHPDLRRAALRVGGAVRGPRRIRDRLHRGGPGRESIPALHQDHGPVN